MSSPARRLSTASILWCSKNGLREARVKSGSGTCRAGAKRRWILPLSEADVCPRMTRVAHREPPRRTCANSSKTDNPDPNHVTPGHPDPTNQTSWHILTHAKPDCLRAKGPSQASPSQRPRYPPPQPHRAESLKPRSGERGKRMPRLQPRSRPNGGAFATPVPEGSRKLAGDESHRTPNNTPTRPGRGGGDEAANRHFPPECPEPDARPNPEARHDV